MASSQKIYDVAIVGFGPTGALLANLLGRDGLRVLVIERDREVYQLPRAVHFDHEVMRIFQSAGVAEAILPHTGPVQGYEFWNADRKVLMSLETGRETTGQGWQSDYMFHQPSLEAELRRGAVDRESVEVLLEHEVVQLSQDRGEVQIRARDLAGGTEQEFRAHYCVGCDGAGSVTRKQTGLELEDLAFDEPWLVVDATIDRPLEELGLPVHCLQLCDPARPTTFVPVTGPYIRWEFMMLPGEGNEVREPACLRALIAAWADPEHVEVIRSAIYRFHAVVGERWRDRRILIAGDAAHQMPPFLGQGMCAGIRDAANLAWKLRLVLEGGARDSLLDTYAAERTGHVRRVIEIAIGMGRIICTRDPEVAAARDAQLLSGSGGAPPQPNLPGFESGLLQRGLRGKLTGELGLQARVAPAGGAPMLLDDCCGPGFALIEREGEAAELSDAALRIAAELDVTRIRLTAAPVGDATPGGEGFRTLHDVDGNYERWFSSQAADAVLVRPDHVVFGAVTAEVSASRLLEDLAQQLGGVLA